MADTITFGGRRPLRYALSALALLGLAGIALRIPILAVPPILPQIHDEFGMSETEVGLLVGLPLGLFALAAVPGSLLVARLGARNTLLAGVALAALTSAARGLAPNLWVLYLMTVLMGVGVAVMQPALPRLVREWVPERIGLATIVYTYGMLFGALTPIAFTTPLMMPLLDQNWRADLIFWAVPVAAIAVLLMVAVPMVSVPGRTISPEPGLWWPNWRSSLTWLLGMIFASNNGMFFALNAVLPEFFTATGRSELIGSSLLWLNLAQIVALFALLWVSDRIVLRAWPFLVFGPVALIGITGLAFLDGIWVNVAAIPVGLATAVTFGASLALPPALSRPDDVHRTAAGMFTIAYACSVIMPVICGALWDASGIPRLAFIPIAACAVGLAVFGGAIGSFRPSSTTVAHQPRA